MNHQSFNQKLHKLLAAQHALLNTPNAPWSADNGVVTRYTNPVLTAAHVPLHWRYHFDEIQNPFLMERIGVNAVFNAGAIKFNGKYCLVARVEGCDRKSFFAIAESDNGIDNFRFWDEPICLPETSEPETNVYDMRLVQHEDGWIYGLFCSESRDPQAAPHDQSAAIAKCGIVKTKDLKHWLRLPNLKTPSPQQRNVVLHPEFINGQYAFYTRPQDGFIEAGSGGGIAFGLSQKIDGAEILEETLIDAREYHTISELKNGLGPAPLKTGYGWLHMAHGVRNTAAGLRYVLYLFMTSLHNPTQIIYKPAGYFMAPQHDERIGDVSNVLFSNGWIADDNETVFIYYASSDTRMHVATTTIEKLVDYVMNTPKDRLRSSSAVHSILNLIESNRKLLQKNTAVAI